MKTDTQFRIMKILRLKAQGMNPTQIAEKVGVSRQRVHQIVNTLSPEQQAQFRSNSRKRKPRTPEVRVCANENCSNTFDTFTNAKRKFCSHTCCTRPSKYASKDEQRLIMNARKLNLYHNDYIFRKVHKAAVKRYYESVKADPIKWAEWKRKQNVYVKAYQARKRLHANSK